VSVTVPHAEHLRRAHQDFHPIVIFWTGEAHLAASLLAIVAAPGTAHVGVVCPERGVVTM
jgi:hypothetical protein